MAIVQFNWLVCDGDFSGDSYCLYSEQATARMKNDPCCCIKHGAILNWADHATIGMTRKEARSFYTARDAGPYVPSSWRDR